MENLILTLHIVVCVVLVLLVLLQSGKEGMGVIFGGGSSSLFGSTGAGGILVKLTTILALVFVVTSLGYNIATSKKMSGESTILNMQIDDPTSVTPNAPRSSDDPSAVPAQPAAPAHSSTTSDASAPQQNTTASQEAAATAAPATNGTR